MKTWSFYDKSTGLFDGQTYSCRSEEFVEMNARGRGFIEGRYDPLSQRVDMTTGAVVDYVPPKPSDEYEWTDAKSWRLKADVAARKEARSLALARIAELESEQHRAVREAALGYLGATERLQAIDDEIAELRSRARLGD